jgi:hypothetical protein
MLNIVKSDIEQSCFCCPIPTRLVLITANRDFPICLDCLTIYEELMCGGMIDPVVGVKLLQRHTDN